MRSHTTLSVFCFFGTLLLLLFTLLACKTTPLIQDEIANDTTAFDREKIPPNRTDLEDLAEVSNRASTVRYQVSGIDSLSLFPKDWESANSLYEQTEQQRRTATLRETQESIARYIMVLDVLNALTEKIDSPLPQSVPEQLMTAVILAYTEPPLKIEPQVITESPAPPPSAPEKPVIADVVVPPEEPASVKAEPQVITESPTPQPPAPEKPVIADVVVPPEEPASVKAEPERITESPAPPLPAPEEPVIAVAVVPPKEQAPVKTEPERITESPAPLPPAPKEPVIADVVAPLEEPAPVKAEPERIAESPTPPPSAPKEPVIAVAAVPPKEPAPVEAEPERITESPTPPPSAPEEPVIAVAAAPPKEPAPVIEPVAPEEAEDSPASSPNLPLIISLGVIGLAATGIGIRFLIPRIKNPRV